MDDPYKVLGIDRDATTEEVKQAYWQRAKQTHPDTDGGDEKEFHKVQRALTTLADPKKRSHYDRTGTDDDGVPDNADAQAINLLVGFFEAAVNEFANVPGSNILQVDLIDGAKKWIQTSIDGLKQQKEKSQANLSKLEAVEKRLRRKTAGKVSTLNRALLTHIDGLRRNVQSKDQQIAANRAAAELLNDYEFEVEAVMQLGGYNLYRAF